MPAGFLSMSAEPVPMAVVGSERKAGCGLLRPQKVPPKTLQEVRALIISRKVKVTSKVERVFRFALENRAEMAFETVGGLARRCDVSNATVVRTAMLFGFGNFHDFRELFRMEIRQSRPGGRRSRSSE